MRAPLRRRQAVLRLLALPFLAAGGTAWAAVAPAAARRPAAASRAASRLTVRWSGHVDHVDPRDGADP